MSQEQQAKKKTDIFFICERIENIALTKYL